MAEAYGKLTGRPGICIVTRGPGATHASVGVHTAFQDSTPLILLVGQVASDQEEREAFQEVDYRRMFGPLAKWVAQIDRADRIPEYVARAFSTACAGRPGPVVLALPEDMLARETDAPDAAPFHVVQPHPGAERDRAPARRCSRGAERPFVDARRRAAGRRARRDGLQTFLEANDAARRRGVPPPGRDRQRLAELRRRRRHRHQPDARGARPRGRPPARRRPAPRRDDDVRLHARSTCRTRQTLVHVHPGAEELGRVYRPTLPILSGMEQFAAAVRDLRVEPRWREWTRGGARRLRGVAAARADAGHARPRRRASRTCASACRDAIVTNGAGNFTVWVHRFWRWHDYPTQLAPTSGAMGYGVPAAVAAKARAPGADGDLLRRRRRLPDERPGARDGGAVRPADRRPRRQQRHVRDDPHAPGAALSRPRRRHRSRQSRLRRVRARLRRARRDRRRDTAQFADALERALAAGTPALLAAADRSRGDQPADDAERDPRGRAE